MQFCAVIPGCGAGHTGFKSLYSKGMRYKSMKLQVFYSRVYARAGPRVHIPGWIGFAR